MPLCADPKIVVKSRSASPNCHSVAPFRLQPPGAGLLYHTYMERPFLFTLAIGFRCHPSLNRDPIESEYSTPHETRAVVTINPSVNGAHPCLRPLGEFGWSA